MAPHAERAPSLREHALEIIRLAIISGDLDEGRIYSAAALAKELEVSLSPVREAMMFLVAEGTVEAVPNRGFRLVPVGETDLEEIFRMRVLLGREAIENLCALVRAEASEKRPGALEDALGGPVHELRELAERADLAMRAGDLHELIRLDREFHRRLIEAGFGKRAAMIGLRLRDQSRPPMSVFVLPGMAQRVSRDLIDLVDAIEAGDADGAVETLEESLYFFVRLAP